MSELENLSKEELIKMVEELQGKKTAKVQPASADKTAKVKKAVKYVADESLFGYTQQQVIDFCMRSPFPGTKSDKWPADHPIWDSFLPGCKSPRDAWSDLDCVTRAVKNAYWIVTKSIAEGKYADFVEKYKKAFEACVTDDQGNIISGDDLLCLILVRFTVAKIAPKVTALRGTDMYKIIEESGVDISSGVYMPMAGFGAIKTAAEMWYKKHGVPKGPDGTWDHLIEAYDINPKFCSWYGWKQRDVLAQVITTDKSVLCCSPFGKNYEHWKGTPDEMSDITFIQWQKLIREHVVAPAYIMVGPEIDKTGTGSNKGVDSEGYKRNGLFTKTTGIMWWDDDTYKYYSEHPEECVKAGIKE